MHVIIHVSRLCLVLREDRTAESASAAIQPLVFAICSFIGGSEDGCDNYIPASKLISILSCVYAYQARCSEPELTSGLDSTNLVFAFLTYYVFRLFAQRKREDGGYQDLWSILSPAACTPHLMTLSLQITGPAHASNDVQRNPV